MEQILSGTNFKPLDKLNLCRQVEFMTQFRIMGIKNLYGILFLKRGLKLKIR